MFSFFLLSLSVLTSPSSVGSISFLKISSSAASSSSSSSSRYFFAQSNVSVSLSVCLFVFISVRLSVSIAVPQFQCLVSWCAMLLCVNLSLFLFASLCIYVCLSVCLSFLCLCPFSADGVVQRQECRRHNFLMDTLFFLVIPDIFFTS